MKRSLSAAAALLLLCTCAIPTAAADSATIYVTVADENGDLALAQSAVTVTDTDNDGALTVNDALYAAHEAFYEGGASVGYGSGMTDYGLSMSKLWGCENGGSYGYYVNNASAWSLADPVADGDYVNAFVYTDLVAWSDTYCFFDVETVSGVSGDTVTLTLSAAGYDADYNPITVPVKDAVITVNGEATSYVTDENGSVSILLGNSGVMTVSATSDTQTIVPPVCTINVASQSIYAPQTGDNTALLALGAGALLTAVLTSRKKLHEN